MHHRTFESKFAIFVTLSVFIYDSIAVVAVNFQLSLIKPHEIPQQVEPRTAGFPYLGAVPGLKGPSQAACPGEFDNLFFVGVLTKEVPDLGRNTLTEIL